MLVRELTDKQKTTLFNANVTVVIMIKHRKGKKLKECNPHWLFYSPPKMFFHFTILHDS